MWKCIIESAKYEEIYRKSVYESNEECKRNEESEYVGKWRINVEKGKYHLFVNMKRKHIMLFSGDI